MTSPQNAFGPGSIASTAAASALKSVLPGMAGGIPIPNISSNAESRSGDALQNSGGFDSSGFNVNFGNGVSQNGGGGIPSWVWLAGAAIAAVWAWKRYT